MQEHGDRLLKAPAKGVSSVEADQGEVGTILVVISLAEASAGTGSISILRSLP